MTTNGRSDVPFQICLGLVLDSCLFLSRLAAKRKVSGAIKIGGPTKPAGARTLVRFSVRRQAGPRMTQGCSENSCPKQVKACASERQFQSHPAMSILLPSVLLYCIK